MIIAFRKCIYYNHFPSKFYWKVDGKLFYVLLTVRNIFGRQTGISLNSYQSNRKKKYEENFYNIRKNSADANFSFPIKHSVPALSSRCRRILPNLVSSESLNIKERSSCRVTEKKAVRKSENNNR